MRVKPKLIHPMLITFARAIIDDGSTDGKKTLNSKWRGPNPDKPIRWETDESKWITVRAQQKNNMFAYFSKTAGGWLRVSKVRFLCYQADVVDDTGRYRFDKADKIVRLSDVKGATKFNVSFQVRDILLRGQYDKVNFVELLCEKIAPEA